MPAPLVSVVVPTFNRPVLLLETLRSILAQTYRELDVIVVDNHSSYDVAAAVASLGDPRVRLLQIHNEGFIGASRNLGIAQARGSLVAFCDDDDLWEPQKIYDQLKAFVPLRHAAVAGFSRYVGDVYFYPRCADGLREESGFDDLLVRGTPALSSLLLPKKDAQFSVTGRFQHVEDFDLLLRLTAGGKSVRILRNPLVRYRVHAANESLDRSKIGNALNVLEAHRERASARSYRLGRGRLYAILGIIALRAGAPASPLFYESLRSRFSVRTMGAWIVAHMPLKVRMFFLSTYYFLRNGGDVTSELP